MDRSPWSATAGKDPTEPSSEDGAYSVMHLAGSRLGRAGRGSIGNRVENARGKLHVTASAISRPRSVRRAGDVPAVLFVDEFEWDCFFQLAAALRRSGFRAVRVTLRPAGRVGSALCWDRTVVLSSASELGNLASILCDEDIVDVHAVETLARQTSEGLAGIGATEGVNGWRERSKCADKLTTATLLHLAGVLVPEAMPLDSATPGEAVRRLGLPLVVKPAEGSGGHGVQVVQALEDLERLVEERAHSDGWFYERFLTGRPLRLGALATELGIERSAVYAVIDPVVEVGPPIEVGYVVDPQLLETGRRVAVALGLTGLFNMDVIRDAAGVDWIHDVNPRVWGSFAAFQSIGLDFVEPYARWLRHQPLADASAPPAATRPLLVFPAAWKKVASPSPRWLAPIRLTRWAWPLVHTFGPGYVLYEFWERCCTALTERVDLATGRVSRSGPTGGVAP